MKRFVLLALGWLCVALGVVGVFLPLLPTTPLLLLAAYLFAGQSARCERWLKSTKVYKRYALPFQKERGFTIKRKLELICLVYALLLISGVLIDHPHVRMVLLAVALVKLIVMIRIPTIRQGETPA